MTTNPGSQGRAFPQNSQCFKFGALDGFSGLAWQLPMFYVQICWPSKIRGKGTFWATGTPWPQCYFPVFRGSPPKFQTRSYMTRPFRRDKLYRFRVGTMIPLSRRKRIPNSTLCHCDEVMSSFLPVPKGNYTE